jgi:hypothetical protein
VAVFRGAEVRVYVAVSRDAEVRVYGSVQGAEARV